MKPLKLCDIVKVLITYRNVQKKESHVYFLAFERKLTYNKLQISCKEPFRFIAYARKNSKRLLSGFFYGGIRARQEAKKAIILQKGHENGGLKKIKLEGEKDEEKEVIIRHQTAPMKWKAWS